MLAGRGHVSALAPSFCVATCVRLPLAVPNPHVFPRLFTAIDQSPSDGTELVVTVTDSFGDDFDFDAYGRGDLTPFIFGPDLTFLAFEGRGPHTLSFAGCPDTLTIYTESTTPVCTLSVCPVSRLSDWPTVDKMNSGFSFVADRTSSRALSLLWLTFQQRCLSRSWA